MTATELCIDPYRALQAASDRTSTFGEVLKDFEEGLLRVPYHQRTPDAWEADKARRYIERLKDSRYGSHPTGFFATYQLREGGPTYLNDGYQRLTTLANAKADPERFGLDEIGVSQLLRQLVSIQHRHFANHEDAMADFQLINFGTRLTPMELCAGYLAYMPEYEQVWRPLLITHHDAIQKSWVKLQRREKPRREAEHKLTRHEYAVFHRFLKGNQAPLAYTDVGRSDIQRTPRNQLIEIRLIDELLGRGRPVIREESKKFIDLIERETAALIELVREVAGPGAGLSANCHRWLLDFAVYCRAESVPVEVREMFKRRFLSETGGGSQIQYQENGERKTLTIQLSNMQMVSTMARIFGLQTLIRPPRRASGRKAQPGYDRSHVHPFVTHGDGETFYEPASVNRARGARAVDNGTASNQDSGRDK